MGGGIATKRGWLLALARLAAIACIAVYEFSVEGRSEKDIDKRSFHVRFDARGTAGGGISETDHFLINSILPAFLGKCSTAVGLEMELYEGLMARSESKTPQPDSLICLNGKDSPKSKLMLKYEFLRNTLSEGDTADELSKWVPAPRISNPKLKFERKITSHTLPSQDFNGSTVTSHCPFGRNYLPGICLVLLEAYDKTKFLFPYALNGTGHPFSTDRQQGLFFSGDLPEGIRKAASSYVDSKPTDSGEPVRATHRDLLLAISSPNDVKTEEEVYATTSSSYTEVALFGVIASGILLIMTVMLSAALLFFRTPLDIGAASYNELSVTAKKLLHRESLSQHSSVMLRFRLEEDNDEGYKLYSGKGV